jgi:uncharacterized repeat protein (TIGR03943 family)
MKNALSKWLPCATLATWSGILLYFYFSHRIDALLHPTFRPFTLVAGIIMLLIAVCFALLPLNVQACSDDDVAAKSFGRQARGRVLTFLILLAPICAAASFSTNGYSSSVFLNRAPLTDLPASPKNATPYVEPPLPVQNPGDPRNQQQNSQPPPAQDEELPRSAEGNIVVQVVDLLYAAKDPDLQATFKGQSVEITGQLMPDTMNNPKGDRFKLVRMFIVCCAADARPVSVLVESPTNPSVPEMGWIKVVGTVEFPVEGGRQIAVIRAGKVIPVDPPEETMLY